MPVAYLSPSLLRELTDVSVSNPGAGEAGRLLTWNGTAFVLRTSSESRTDLNLGTLATQNANAVAITGGAISGITPLPLASGGTNSNNGSIAGTGALTLAAGGTNQNVILQPSGTGSVDFGSVANPITGNFYLPGGQAESGFTVTLPPNSPSISRGIYLRKGEGFFAAQNGTSGSDGFSPTFIGKDVGTSGVGLAFGALNALSDPFAGVYFVTRNSTNTGGVSSSGRAFYFENGFQGGTSWAECLTILGNGASTFHSTTESTSTSTGAVRIDGGLGVAKNVNIGGNLRFAGGTVPATAASAGTTGDIRYDGSHLYICTATNTWVRTALSTW